MQVSQLLSNLSLGKTSVLARRHLRFGIQPGRVRCRLLLLGMWRESWNGGYAAHGTKIALVLVEFYNEEIFIVFASEHGVEKAARF